jgi:hypothetical protein
MVLSVAESVSPLGFVCCATAGGEVIFRGAGGLYLEAVCDCFCRLPEDVAALNGGVLFVPMFAKPTTLSLASAASDLLLLLVISPVDEAECW